MDVTVTIDEALLGKRVKWLKHIALETTITAVPTIYSEIKKERLPSLEQTFKCTYGKPYDVTMTDKQFMDWIFAHYSVTCWDVAPFTLPGDQVDFSGAGIELTNFNYN